MPNATNSKRHSNRAFISGKSEDKYLKYKGKSLEKKIPAPIAKPNHKESRYKIKGNKRSNKE